MDMVEDRETCAQDARSEAEIFGTRRLALIRISTATPGSSGSSVTLVRTVTSWVVVDSGGSADRDEIVRSFAENKVRLEKVNVLLSTSLDPSTSGNDDLFPHALHHVKKTDWGKVRGPNPRRVAINTPSHWIDKYMKVVKVQGPSEEHIVLIVHFPNTEDLLDPSSRRYCGRRVGILGRAFFSPADRDNAKLLEVASKRREAGEPRPEDPRTIPDILLYCDTVFPGQGDPIDLS
jgi:hypothetical protein